MNSNVSTIFASETQLGRFQDEKKTRRDYINNQMHEDTKLTMEIRKNRKDADKAYNDKYHKAILDIAEGEKKDKYVDKLVSFYDLTKWWKNQ